MKMHTEVILLYNTKYCMSSVIMVMLAGDDGGNGYVGSGGQFYGYLYVVP